MKRSHLLVPTFLLAAIGLGCNPAPPPNMQVLDIQPNSFRIARHFPTEGITKIVFRSATNRVELVPFEDNGTGATLEVTGQYASNFFDEVEGDRLSPARRSPDFVAMKYGYTLVISTKNEIRDRDQLATFESFGLRLPRGIQVVMEQRNPTPHGRPDLSQPKV
jgi:hypothetical protein